MGTGKSILPAAFINGVMRQWPDQRFAMVTHVKELIAQNSEELLKLWPTAPLGIHSAGLKQRDYAHSIIYGGVQSMVKRADWFGRRDIVFIDECFSADTEILTENGFVRFDWLGGQKVAQYDAATKNISFVQPIRKIKKRPSSKMIRVESQNNFDLHMTENHEMLVTSQSGIWGKRS